MKRQRPFRFAPALVLAGAMLSGLATGATATVSANASPPLVHVDFAYDPANWVVGPGANNPLPHLLIETRDSGITVNTSDARPQPQGSTQAQLLETIFGNLRAAGVGVEPMSSLPGVTPPRAWSCRAFVGQPPGRSPAPSMECVRIGKVFSARMTVIFRNPGTADVASLNRLLASVRTKDADNK